MASYVGQAAGTEHQPRPHMSAAKEMPQQLVWRSDAEVTMKQSQFSGPPSELQF